MLALLRSKKVAIFIGVALGAVIILHDNPRFVPSGIIFKESRENLSFTKELREIRSPTQDDANPKTCSNKIRREHIHEVCHTYSWPPPGVQRRMMFVIDQYKLLYCDIPKCGSTTFKTILGDLVMPVGYKYDFNHYTDATGYKMYHELTPEKQKKVINEYFKMVVLRHPLDRLRSAYTDKIMAVGDVGNMMRGYFQNAIKEYLIEKGQVTESSFKLHEDILTFEQFLELVLRQQDNFKNIHWESYWNLCDPCHFKYDLIIKLETLEDNLPELYDFIRSKNSSARLPETIPHRNVRIKANNENKLHLVSEMIKDMNQELIRNITELYRKDMLFAGYGWNTGHGAFCKLSSRDCC